MLILVLPVLLFSQLPESKIILISGDTIEIKPLLQSEITPESEVVNKRLSEIEKYLGITARLNKIDSVLTQKADIIGEERDEVLKNLENLSQREVDDQLLKWDKTIKELTSVQEQTSDISKKLERDLEYIKVTKKTWQITYKKIKDTEGSEETLKWINAVVQRLKSIERNIKDVQNKNFKVQNRIVNLINLSEGVKNNLVNLQLSWTSRFFERDSPPIWHLSDSLTANHGKSEKISVVLKKNIKSIWTYFGNNKGDITIMVFIFIILFLFYYYANRHLAKEEEQGTEIDSRKFIFKHYISSSLILTILSNLWISPERPVMVTQFYVIILMVPALIIFSKKVSKRLIPYLLFVVAIFLIDEASLFFGISNNYSRILLLIKSGIVLWLFLLISNPKGFIQQELKGSGWWRAAFYLSYVFTLLVIVSVFANIFGYVNLSALQLKATIGSLLFAIILSIVNTLLKSTFSFLISRKAVLAVNMIRNHFELIKKRIDQIIVIYLSFLWIKITLGYFGLWKMIILWLGGLMDTEWAIGSVSISFAGIITFFVVLIVTFTLSKIVTVILQEEIFPRIVLPRGVPGAITKMASYVIIAYGVYVALESAGVDFKQFGLIAGALGVGIGFGLQNIVANFISGLVLSFERPIQAGDTIEVGNLMGEVKDIGVRASTLKTFDGAEVIVPNLNLISNDVINWTLSDRKRRRIVKVATAYGTDPHKVLKLLFDVASSHPSVLKNPKPWITFDGFGESSLNFTLRFWATFDSGLTIQSEVAMMVYDALNEAGIQIPFPQQDLHIKSFDPTVQTTIYPWTNTKNENDLTSDKNKPGKKKDSSEDEGKPEK